MNNLTPAQTERIAKLSEELGEAQQVIGKILLHGYRAQFQETVYDNKGDLERELGDVKAAIQLMTDAGDLDDARIRTQQLIKRQTITRYMCHQAIEAYMQSERQDDPEHAPA